MTENHEKRSSYAAAIGRTKPTRANGMLTSDDLLEAKRLADRLGGIQQARAALETLEHT